MHLLPLEKSSGNRYENVRREAEGERMIRATTGHGPRRAWVLSLGRGLVHLGQTFERLGECDDTFS
jgi:hypothetical protein